MHAHDFTSRLFRFFKSRHRKILLRAFIQESAAGYRGLWWRTSLYLGAGKKKDAGKLNLRRTVHTYYGSHRSGWSFAIKSIGDLHHPEGVITDGFIERTFSWNVGRNTETYNKPWIGFIHTPPGMPEWYHPVQTNTSVFSSGQWKESSRFCKGLFALSDYHRLYLSTILDIPINTVLHPAEFPELTWNFERFAANNRKIIVQVGLFLRKLHSIYILPEGNYVKVFLRKNDIYLDQLLRQEKENSGISSLLTPEVMSSARVVDHMSNHAYDRMLSESIVFLDLYDASACNTILECIARNTPLLVNRIPPVVEYLGGDYPLYFTSLQEAADKAADIDLVRKAHLYLKDHPYKFKFTGQYFKESLIRSSIYQSL